jgi:arylformamidase
MMGVLVMRTYVSRPLRLTRRSILGSAAATIAAPAAFAQECRLGPPEHHKGPTVFMNYDQLELDAAYDQDYYEPLGGQTYARLASKFR